MNRRCIHQIEPPAQGASMDLIGLMQKTIEMAEEARRARQPVPEGMGPKWGQSGSQAQANEVADAKLDQLRQGTPYPAMQLAAAIVEQMPEPWREEPSGSLVPAGNGAQSPPPLDLQLPAAAPLSVVGHIPQSTSAWNRPPEFIGAGTPESERILKGIKGLPYGPSPVSAVPPPPAAQAQANTAAPNSPPIPVRGLAQDTAAFLQRTERYAGKATSRGPVLTLDDLIGSMQQALQKTGLDWGPKQQQKLLVSMMIAADRQGRLVL